MANPRKFSEKIALHTHRQAEETARFEQIMKEVSDATCRVQPVSNPSKYVLSVNNHNLGSFHGGSLPNVSAGTHNAKKVPHTAFIKQEESLPCNQRQWRESRTRSHGGPIRRPQDRKHDTSPYSTSPSPSPFLSPPPDISWRRTNSDSALHQSGFQGPNYNNENDKNFTGRWILQTLSGSQNLQDRPRSSCDVPCYPGTEMYTMGQDTMSNQIPIGKNTGSLPDLTTVHFHSPIHSPLESDQDPEYQSYKSNFVHYRTPRPSPQPSPLLGGRISEPCSPKGLNASGTDHSGTINDIPLLNQHQLQQHFEQFSVADLPLNPDNNLSFLGNDKNIHMSQMSQNASDISASELITDNGYYSTSPSSHLVYCTKAPTNYTAPNTPTSIPDIILTDFSSGEAMNQSLALTKQIEAELLSDESLRDGLEPLDLDGLPILSDSSINLISESVENHFRSIDRL